MYLCVCVCVRARRYTSLGMYKCLKWSWRSRGRIWILLGSGCFTICVHSMNPIPQPSVIQPLLTTLPLAPVAMYVLTLVFDRWLLLAEVLIMYLIRYVVVFWPFDRLELFHLISNCESQRLSLQVSKSELWCKRHKKVMVGKAYSRVFCFCCSHIVVILGVSETRVLVGIPSPLLTFYNVKGWFKWHREPLNSGEVKGKRLTLAKNGYIRMNLMENIWRHLKWIPLLPWTSRFPYFWNNSCCNVCQWHFSTDIILKHHDGNGSW
jgi:hypothetical protein